MKINLFFNPKTCGHILEYIHHVYMNCQGEDKFIFVVDEDFKDRRNLLEWPERTNAEFVFLSTEDYTKCNCNNGIKLIWNTSWTIRKYVLKFRADNVFLNYLIDALPLLPFILPRSCKVSGIIYRIPLYDDIGKSAIRRWADKVTYQLATFSRSQGTVLFLNDKRAPLIFNKLLRSKKFKYLTDPVLATNQNCTSDLRVLYHIPQDSKIFFQFGFDKRKSTDLILDALNLMTPEELKGKTFVFGGKINSERRSIIEPKLNALRHKANIIIRDEYLSYEELNNWLSQCDRIFVLYTNWGQSSGTIGYGALYHKPVIAPSQGLLGQLVTDYNLGLTIDNVDAQSIKKAILTNIEYEPNEYLATHTVKEFTDTVLETLK